MVATYSLEYEATHSLYIKWGDVAGYEFWTSYRGGTSYGYFTSLNMKLVSWWNITGIWNCGVH